MKLLTYKSKRNFNRTPEPPAPAVEGKSHEQLIFVVQKHQASHLHYDFRLELGGVLKSWAVPKGPSLNPAHKRLAVMVEDHPLEYAQFHGVIPEGNYGAGKVEIWDHGSYAPYSSQGKEADEKEIAEELKKGHLTLILKGNKLKGEFALVKTGQTEDSWLLIKKNDRHATDREVTQEESTAKRVINLDAFPLARLPHRVSPMLATLVKDPFDREGWYFEIKWDGYRAIAEIEKKEVRLYSRNNLVFNSRFPEIVSELEKLNIEAVMDGEIVVLGKDGLPSFQLMQDFPKSKRGTLVYVVFDLLYLNGHDLQKSPLSERKRLLKQILPEIDLIVFCEHVESLGKQYFQAAAAKGLEGIMAKDPNSPYRQGERGMDWQKIKTHLQQEAVIGGFTQPRGSRSRFGALLLGVYEDSKLRYIGSAGSGFDDKKLDEMYARLRPLIRKACPFDVEPEANAPATWVKPKLVCEVEFAEWTNEGLMRQPVFMGLREDKNPPDVARERETEANQKQEFSHLDKIFWPKEKYTKGRLIEYYKEISQVLLPYLKDRPESLLRYPDGITGKSFYHKDVGGLVPDWMKTVPILLDEGEKTVHFCLVSDTASLTYLINLGCIDLNPWNSRVGSDDRPDYAIIDLDPENTPFQNVVKTALVVHEVLEGAGISGYCKTSGARGMHIYIPLGAKYTYEQARTFCLLISTLVNRKLPGITSLERSPDKRQGKVYLDCFQNARGHTLASVYSVRPEAGAPVSTPLAWEELNDKIRPADYNIENTLRRLEKVGDLFKPVLGKGIDMEKALRHLESV